MPEARRGALFDFARLSFQRTLHPSLAGVGKTCLLLRYANNSFSPTFITTIGIDFKIKTITVDSKRIKLQVRPRLPFFLPHARWL